MREWLAFVRRTPCLLLLVVQLAGVVLYPFMEGNFVGRTMFSAFGILVLLLTIRALRATPYFTWFSGLVFVPAVILLAASVVTGDQELIPWSAAFEMALYFYAAGAMVAYMLKDRDLSTDEIFAIPATFTLLAWAFAYLFLVVQALDSGAFGESARSWMDLLFLSFTNLSSVGLSDVVPVSSHARSVVMLEQLAGVFYIAMVVTRLITFRFSRRSA
jgi:hypothetical protein